MKNVLRLVLVLGGLFLGSVLCVVACVTTTAMVNSADYREKAERTDVRELHLSAGGLVRVETPYGDVRVRTAASGTGSMRALVVAHGKTAEDARARLERGRVVIDERDGGVAISFDFPVEKGRVTAEPAPTVDFELEVPAGMRLELSSSSGDISATAGPFGSSSLKSNYGDVAIENVRGDVRVSSSSGKVALARHSDGTAEVRTNYGDVSLADVDATNLVAHTSSGDVVAEKIAAAELKLDSNYGDVRIRGARGTLTAHSSSGEVVIEDATGAVSANSNYGEVAVDGVLRMVTAHSSSGEVKIRARAGSTIESAWRIDSNYGGVSLAAPADLAFELEAKTSYGDVEVGYPIELPPGTTTKKGSRLRGKVNGGGALVTLESSSGDVSVRPLGP